MAITNFLFIDSAIMYATMVALALKRKRVFKVTALCLLRSSSGAGPFLIRADHLYITFLESLLVSSNFSHFGSYRELTFFDDIEMPRPGRR